MCCTGINDFIIVHNQQSAWLMVQADTQNTYEDVGEYYTLDICLKISDYIGFSNTRGLAASVLYQWHKCPTESTFGGIFNLLSSNAYDMVSLPHETSPMVLLIPTTSKQQGTLFVRSAICHLSFSVENNQLSEMTIVADEQYGCVEVGKRFFRNLYLHQPFDGFRRNFVTANNRLGALALRDVQVEPTNTKIIYKLFKAVGPQSKGAWLTQIRSLLCFM